MIMFLYFVANLSGKVHVVVSTRVRTLGEKTSSSQPAAIRTVLSHLNIESYVNEYYMGVK